MLNFKLIETNGMTGNEEELKVWGNWEYTDDLMAEIKRRELYSVFDIQKDSDGKILADKSVPEPEIMVLAICKMDEMNDPFGD